MDPTIPHDYDYSPWQDMGHSVHEIGMFEWDSSYGLDWDPYCMMLVPFDENALRI